MNPIRIMVLNEVRMRLRRRSTLVALLAVAALCWLGISDPADGITMMMIDGRRVLYTSQALAFGSAHIAGMLLGLAGFYLVRGRVTDDLQSGMGAVIGATAASNALLVTGRWLGSMAYLMLFVLAYLGSTLALHALRGEGPVQLLVYLQTYALLLLPILSYAAACAVLFDNISALVGRRGDVLFFFLWCLQFGALVGVTESPGALWPMLLDFSGVSVAVTTLREHFATTEFVLGRSAFDPAAATLVIPDSLWTLKAWGIRAVTLALSFLLLLPATLFFHRYAPDRVRPRSARGNRMLALADRMLRPVAVAARPLPGLAMHVPGFAGEVLAEVALVLSMSSSAVLVLAAGTVAAAVAAPGALPGLMIAGVACWGAIVCGIVPRDWQSGADAMTGALPGGVVRRYLRQWAASLVLALPLVIVALRWSADAPIRAVAALVGVLALASAASLLGGLTRGSRLFLALFLFTWYIALNSPKQAALDMVGFNGTANTASVAAWAVAGCLAWAAGFAHSRWRRA